MGRYTVKNCSAITKKLYGQYLGVGGEAEFDLEEDEVEQLENDYHFQVVDYPTTRQSEQDDGEDDAVQTEDESVGEDADGGDD